MLKIGSHVSFSDKGLLERGERSDHLRLELHL